MRVLIAPDKFKGSLTAAEVADHVAKGLTGAGAHITALPLADGGDGSVAAALASGFHPLPADVRAATGDSHRTTVAFNGDTAIVEVANTCGLVTLPGGKLHPMTASSYGFGQAVRAALTLSGRRLVLALGGSASTDGGVGMLAALGYRFLDRAGNLLAATAANLDRIHCVDSRHAIDVTGVDVVVAGDVTSPLIGLTGAAAVFGPQKGATAAQVAQLDHGLGHLVAAFTRSGFADAPGFARAAGSGAAGGIGFAAMLLGASMASGAEYFLDLLDFDRHATGADLVITGEGRLDHQTLHGKLPAAVAMRAAPTPVIAVVGRNDLERDASTVFTDVFAVTDYTDTDTSRDPLRTAELLRHIGTQIGSRFTTSV
ncbi:glycerate kinase [Mycolicibacterium sp. P1-18]|uniref:glycerate kinase n=1 Tax=Mycolicibacterium sp. P1-18 TaxID=2024615 RepID=UPI0011F1DFC4|nr:glycerate kinase [Mycolicibacterium sp. P1-18]KAA0098011.1 glycerate kinase [Mycolicibacterium sp. P1-18]